MRRARLSSSAGVKLKVSGGPPEPCPRRKLGFRCAIVRPSTGSTTDSTTGGDVTGSILGNRVIRKEDPKFLTTGGVYVDDMDEPLLEGALHVTYARRRWPTPASPASTPRRRLGRPVSWPCTPPPISACSRYRPPSTRRRARTLLASDVTRYVGEPLAAIVTERKDQGEDAAELVEVDYELLEVFLDVEEAATSSTHPARRPQRGVRLDGARHARPDRRVLLRGLRRRGERAARQPAARPVS